MDKCYQELMDFLEFFLFSDVGRGYSWMLPILEGENHTYSILNEIYRNFHLVIA